jgi:acyl carrier protein
MNRDIEAALWAYLRENCLPRSSEVAGDDAENLFETGVIDSAGLISFVCFIEEEFNMTIPDEDLLPEHFMSISSIAAYLRSRQKHPLVLTSKEN